MSSVVYNLFIPIILQKCLKVIENKYPQYLIYLNYNKLNIYSSDYDIVNSDFELYLRQPIIISSPIVHVTTTVDICEQGLPKLTIPIIIEAHENAKMFYLKLYLNPENQQQFYRFVDLIHKKSLKETNDLITEEEYNKAAALVNLPQVVISQYSRLKYLPEDNPPATSMTDIPTLIKYSNLLIDDFIQSKAIHKNSKYNTI